MKTEICEACGYVDVGVSAVCGRCRAKLPGRIKVRNRRLCVLISIIIVIVSLAIVYAPPSNSPSYRQQRDDQQRNASNAAADTKEDIDMYNPFDVVIDSNVNVRLKRAAAFAQFLFAEYGKGNRIITKLAKTPGYQYEFIGFRGLEWGTDVSQIDDLMLPLLDVSGVRGIDNLSSRKGDATEIDMPLEINSRFVGRFYIQGVPMYCFYKNKLVEVSIIMVTLPEYDKLPYCISDTFGPLSYISSDGKQVWDGNVTDISLAFDRSEFMGKTMHTYKIVFKKSDDL